VHINIVKLFLIWQNSIIDLRTTGDILMVMTVDW